MQVSRWTIASLLVGWCWLTSCGSSDSGEGSNKPPGPDASTSDTGSDAPQGCTGNQDCAGNAGTTICDVATGKCVQCLPGNDVCPASEHCDSATSKCVSGCKSDEGCAGQTGKHCDVSAHACVECTADSHCSAGQKCTANKCVETCGDGGACSNGLTCCGGVCADPQTDVAHCGACGNACSVPANAASATCAAGQCGFLCDSTHLDCDKTASNGCEVQPADDIANCGACGNACSVPANAASATCAAGQCGFSCDSIHLDCDQTASNGCETNPSVNVANCGTCGTACMAGAVCAKGACACPLGTALCSGACVSLNSDPANCGSCGNACPSGNVCVAGACKTSCPTGTTLCAGKCVLLGIDNAHCGACNNACAAETACSGGACVPLVGTSNAGCADGQREGFTDTTAYPDIAACAGGWTLPGIFPPPLHSGASACVGNGDDSTSNPGGTGCSSVDLCAPGWHVCRGGDILPRTNNAGCASGGLPAGSFFAASVSGTGCGQCALLSGTVTTGCGPNTCTGNCLEDPTLNNDFFGCGTVGAAANCAGLNRFSNNDCASLPAPWVCNGAVMESITVTKAGAASGGVLCCR
ncbi:MAG: hypothetical protein AMXMBFR56_52670 [Polyangiaceae bacterium]